MSKGPKPNNCDISGVILSGGQNRRMRGLNKAFIDIDGKIIIDKTITLFKDLFKEVIIVTNCPEEYRKYRNVHFCYIFYA